jgi:uncharacterized protein
MPYHDTPSEVQYILERDSAFSYRCNGCKNCCHNKVIRGAPYEILRLARRLGVSTTRFIADYTEAGGTVPCTRGDDRACIFLRDYGCGIHSDRPRACRLYPLARWVDPDGTESFGYLAPHPQTTGTYGVSGTVASYLEPQEVDIFFLMGERYGELYQRMVDVLERLDPNELDRRSERRHDVEDMEAGTPASTWFEVDETVATYCKANGKLLPDGIEETVALHIEVIERWLSGLGAK